ncbi:hypothetical protein [Pseudoalteromonas phenolica]|nr:hypothetical protein [Pseudoalteromonas phenolica]
MENLKEKSDIYLNYFWRVFFIAITLGVFSGGFILYDAYVRYELCFSHQCLNFFFKEIMFLPFSILATALPICAIFLALHKSEQAKQQIAITEMQNLTSNLFTHKKEFHALCNHIENNFPVIIDWQLTYSKMFPDNTKYSGNAHFTSETTGFFDLDNSVREFLTKLKDLGCPPSVDDAVHSIFMIDSLYQKAGISFNHHITPCYLKDVCDETGITNYLEIHLVNNSEFENWEVYSKIMKQFSFFANTSFEFNPSDYNIGRLNNILAANDRITYKVPR